MLDHIRAYIDNSMGKLKKDTYMFCSAVWFDTNRFYNIHYGSFTIIKKIIWLYKSDTRQRRDLRNLIAATGHVILL